MLGFKNKVEIHCVQMLTLEQYIHPIEQALHVEVALSSIKPIGHVVKHKESGRRKYPDTHEEHGLILEHEEHPEGQASHVNV